MREEPFAPLWSMECSGGGGERQFGKIKGGNMVHMSGHAAPKGVGWVYVFFLRIFLMSLEILEFWQSPALPLGWADPDSCLLKSESYSLRFTEQYTEHFRSTFVRWSTLLSAGTEIDFQLCTLTEINRYCIIIHLIFTFWPKNGQCGFRVAVLL